VSSFSTSTDLPATPKVRWKQSTKKQFARNRSFQTATTDSGVTVAPSIPLELYVRSVGYHYNQFTEYYSTIRVNEQRLTGYWWETGSSFVAVRINDFSGEAEYRFFPLFQQPGQPNAVHPDTMVEFIRRTPVGNYLGFAVVFDGRTNVSESLYVAIESLGSLHIRQLQPGHTWAFIGRKGQNGPGMIPLEAWSTTDTSVVSFQILNIYRLATGSISSREISVPASWDTFHWRATGAVGTNAFVGILGTRTNGIIDTLRFIPKDSLDVDLAWLSGVTSGEKYRSISLTGFLSTNQSLLTPVLHEWWMDFVPPADLAISARTVGPPSGVEQTGVQNVAVTAYNIGYQRSDSSNVTLSVFDRNNRARRLTTVTMGAIEVNQSQTTVIPISTLNLPRRTTVQAEIAPPKKDKDLVAENNIAYYTFTTSGGATDGDVRIYSDGVEVADGDFISSKPTLLVKPRRNEGVAVSSVELFVDNLPFSGDASHSHAVMGNVMSEASFNPTLTDGEHELKILAVLASEVGDIDSLTRRVSVKVLSESRIIQIFNYPNPFRQETYFTVMISGSASPDELGIRIFTVGGRKIREIVVPRNMLQVGFNRVYWDGRDAEGDEVANGYYFYQVSLKAGGKTVSSVEKLVKAR
jgi:hypothetical protein